MDRTAAQPQAVVTGGAGFLGSHRCDRLLSEGYRVVCVDDLSTGSEDNLLPALADPAFCFIPADVSSQWRVSGPVDVVFHLASAASPRDYQRLARETLQAGSQGTTRALDLAERWGARFVLASSSEVYGDPAVHPQTEDYRGNVDPAGPRSMYDEAKRFGEALTAAYRRSGVDAGIVRIFNTYGPRMRSGDGRVVPAFLDQAVHGEPFTVAGDGSQTRSMCYVDDTVGALVEMGRRPGVSGPLNIGNPQEITVREVASVVARIAGVPDEAVEVERPPHDPERRCPDITAARRELGWEPRVDLEDGLRRTLAWWRQPRTLASAR